jgi:hypothetical protein
MAIGRIPSWEGWLAGWALGWQLAERGAHPKYPRPELGLGLGYYDEKVKEVFSLLLQLQAFLALHLHAHTKVPGRPTSCETKTKTAHGTKCWKTQDVR